MNDNEEKLLYEMEWVCDLDHVLDILTMRDKTNMSDVQKQKIKDARSLLKDVNDVQRAKAHVIMTEMGCDQDIDDPLIALRIYMNLNMKKKDELRRAYNGELD